MIANELEFLQATIDELRATREARSAEIEAFMAWLEAQDPIPTRGYVHTRKPA